MTPMGGMGPLIPTSGAKQTPPMNILVMFGDGERLLGNAEMLGDVGSRRAIFANLVAILAYFWQGCANSGKI